MSERNTTTLSISRPFSCSVVTTTELATLVSLDYKADRNVYQEEAERDRNKATMMQPDPLSILPKVIAERISSPNTDYPRRGRKDVYPTGRGRPKEDEVRKDAQLRTESARPRSMLCALYG